MAKLNLSAPWVTYYRQLNALFREDGQVKVLFNEEEMEIKLFVSDAKKACALEKLLPTRKTFGGVSVDITVVPPNCDPYTQNIDVIKEAFRGNLAVVDVVTVDNLFGYDLHYVVFQREIVQYFTDDISDYNGYHSTLYEDIAREILDGITGVFFCTEVDSWLGEPCEWP